MVVCHIHHEYDNNSLTGTVLIDELELAYQKCEDTYSGTGGCYNYEYLLARHEYNKLLFKKGLIDLSGVEPEPLRLAGDDTDVACRS